MSSPRAYLVESIPKGLEDLRGTPGVAYTEDVLARLTTGAKRTIDLTAMYWSLVPDKTGADESGFTDTQFEAFGAGDGRVLYQALHDAAARGVSIRILQSPGFGGGKQESDALQAQFPNQVHIHQVSMPAWYGDGIMHQKIWAFDRLHVYLGSANMDWKSIAQVKEMGVAIENCSEIADDATRYFEAWWTFSALSPSCAGAYDPAAHIWRRVPDWSELVPLGERKTSPLNDDGYRARSSRLNPLKLELNDEVAGVYLTGSPGEVCGPGRTHDDEALVQTILEAGESVCISVMDFAPVSLFGRKHDDLLAGHQDPRLLNTPVWWPDLIDALLHVVLTRKVNARLLVSKWAHSSPLIEPYLRALQQTAAAGRANPGLASGSLEVRQFIVPDWASTEGAGRKFPGHTRVNHTKFIVTDQRLNIGTSNMTWDYFAATAGSSFNTDHAGLVRNLQVVFDRDWESRYAHPL